MNNLETTQAIYAAFSRGDVPFILEQIADDVKWEQWPAHTAQARGVPYLKAREGRQGVADFFASLAGLEFHDFQVRGFLEGDRRVCAMVDIELTVKATGRRLRDPELHLWTFDDKGRVVGFHHYLDTAKHIAANFPAGAVV